MKNYLIAVQENIFIRSTLKQLETSLTRCGKIQNTKAKKETLSKLEKIEKGELTSRNQKSLQGFEKLKEYKFNKIRIIVESGQKGAPEQIVGIVKKSRLNDLNDLLKTFKNKFK